MALSNKKGIHHQLLGEKVPANIQDLIAVNLSLDIKQGEYDKIISSLLLFIIAKAHQYGIPTFLLDSRITELQNYIHKMVGDSEILANHVSKLDILTEWDLSRLRYLDSIKDFDSEEKFTIFQFEYTQFEENPFKNEDFPIELFEENVKKNNNLFHELATFNRNLNLAGIVTTQFTQCINSICESLENLSQFSMRSIDLAIAQEERLEDIYRLSIFTKLVQITKEGMAELTDDGFQFYGHYLIELSKKNLELLQSIDFKEDLDFSNTKAFLQDLKDDYQIVDDEDRPF